MEKYEELEMEIIAFTSEDIITASGDIPLDPVQNWWEEPSGELSEKPFIER